MYRIFFYQIISETSAVKLDLKKNTLNLKMIVACCYQLKELSISQKFLVAPWLSG
jgi:hypothetical protein